ncbi:MAG: lytic transglycosylase domain-containing protein [Candidatus Micrarchaeota archaeon]
MKKILAALILFTTFATALQFDEVKIYSGKTIQDVQASSDYDLVISQATSIANLPGYYSQNKIFGSNPFLKSINTELLAGYKLTIPGNAVKSRYAACPFGQSSQRVLNAIKNYAPLLNTQQRKIMINDPFLLACAVAYQESGFNPNAGSPKGAKGVFQLMPATASSACHLPENEILNVEKNVECGIRYLALQLSRFGRIDLALAAYNAGPARVSKYNGIPPIKETVNYVNRITSLYNKHA